MRPPFLTSHDIWYDGCCTNEERAAAEFACAGSNSDAVLQQAVPLEISEALKRRLEGPVDTGGAGCAAGHNHEQVVAVDDEPVEEEAASESEAEVAVNAAMPDPEYPAEALPAMHCCADELTSGDLGELQAIRKVHAELEQLMGSMR